MQKRFKLIMALLLVGAILWNVYWNQSIVMRTYTCQNSDIPESFQGYRIVQLTDIHSVRDVKQGEMIYEKVHLADPDVICITGDLIDSAYYKRNGIKGEQYTLRLLEELLKIAPVYMVYGNHEMVLLDNPDQNAFKVAVEKLGVEIINNKSFKIYSEDREEYIRLAGIQDPATLYKSFRYAGIKTNGDRVEAMLDTVTVGVRSEEFVLLLSHRPEYLEMYDQYSLDVCLTGHAHGGQFRIPFVGGVYAPGQGFFPKYTKGVYRTDDLEMYVGVGIGNSTIPLRIFNPPEILTIVLE
jgi:predicted MPP superfamily phosphohydrolase